MKAIGQGRRFALSIRYRGGEEYNLDMLAFPDGAAMNIDEHRTTPHISIDQYVRSRLVALGRSLDGRAAVYLDTKFWIILRKAQAGVGSHSDEVELLKLLRRLTTEGRVFCPISESIFMELMKQADSKSRLETARLIDELSLGVTLTSYDTQLATELAHYIKATAYQRDALYPLHHLIWSKLVYVLGFQHPASTPFDAATELAIKKAFFDKMWATSLAEIVTQIGGAMPPEGVEFTELAGNLNDGTAQHADELRSFAQAYAAELRGVVDACGDMLMEIVTDVMAREAGSPPPRGSAEWLNLQATWKSVVFEALKKGSAKQQLRSMHIGACLHAAFRWNKARRFTANDIYDFQHAAAALAHCRGFFTEHSLRTIVTANHVALDKLYDCRVVSEVAEAVEFLRGMDAKTGSVPAVQ
jgi:hypothetical protein